MTVSSDTNRQTYGLNGATQDFPVPFYFFADTDLLVTHTTFGADGTATVTPLVLNSDYTVSGAANEAGGSIHTAVALSAGHNDNIVIKRAIDATQLTEYPPNTPFPASSHERALDKLTMLTQQLATDIAFCMRTPDVGGGTPEGVTPVPVPSGIWQWDPTGTKVQFLPVGGGTVQVGTVLTTPSTGQHFAQNGANIHRLNDRVFVGGATLNDGRFPGNKADWFSAWEADELGVSSISLAGQLAVLNGPSDGDASAIAAAAQSLNFSSASTSCMGVQAIAVNNNASLSTNAWGIYAEAHRTTAAAGSVYGMELDVRTLTAAQAPTPYGQGTVTGLQLGAGAGVSSAFQSNPSTAIEIIDNPMQWQAGIVFNSSAIAGTDGQTAGTGIAVALAKNHALQWYGPGAVITGRVVCRGTTAANAVTLEMGDAAFNVRSRGNDNLQFVAAINDAAVNYPRLASAVTGSGVELSAQGADANVDLKLTPRGGGAVTLPSAAKLQWASGSTPLSFIQCAASGSGETPVITLADGQIQFKSSGVLRFQMIFTAGNVNYLQTYASSTGAPPQLAAAGNDTNIDLLLTPKGTGNLRFGTYTATAPSATGYITVKDSAGNVRKLLCA